ncbi:MAG: radical SAM protein [Planctomycetota bacterium]|nr:radical SAM protein [Planctomycetota bacterium]
MAAIGSAIRAGLPGTIAGAVSFALRVPLLRDCLLRGLFRSLDRAYAATTEDRALLLNDRWWASTLVPFIERLVAERPAAAKAVVRFIATWVMDMYRREERRKVGKANPVTIVIEPTDRCNLKCPGCYAKSGRDGSDMSFEHLHRVVEEAIGMGVTLITVSGGEPFLREHQDQTISRLARKFPDRGFLVYTNGTLIDEDIARSIGETGNVFPAISVEGFETQTDARRGSGTYSKTRRAREILARHGVMTGFSATVTRENADGICSDEFIEQRIAEGDLFGWFFLLQPIGRSPRPDLMVTSEQRAKLRETIYRWRDQRKPILLGDFWNDGPLVDGCIAGGRHYLHIYANGDISPCVFSPVAGGNIIDIIEGRSEYKSLDEFVQKNPVFRAFREEQSRISDRRRPCLLMDHPDAFRRIYQRGGCRPAKNMPGGYLDGHIAHHLDETAESWKRMAERLRPLMPGEFLQQDGSGKVSEADVAKMSVAG